MISGKEILKDIWGVRGWDGRDQTRHFGRSWTGTKSMFRRQRAGHLPKEANKLKEAPAAKWKCPSMLITHKVIDRTQLVVRLCAARIEEEELTCAEMAERLTRVRGHLRRGTDISRLPSSRASNSPVFRLSGHPQIRTSFSRTHSYRTTSRSSALKIHKM